VSVLFCLSVPRALARLRESTRKQKGDEKEESVMERGGENKIKGQRL